MVSVELRLERYAFPRQVGIVRIHRGKLVGDAWRASRERVDGDELLRGTKRKSEAGKYGYQSLICVTPIMQPSLSP
jgi:hypothetical protein